MVMGRMIKIYDLKDHKENHQVYVLGIRIPKIQAIIF
jgi:hypothetical protein